MLIIRTGKLKGTYRNESFIFDDAMTETEIVEKVEQLDETGSFTNNGQFYDTANKNLLMRLLNAIKHINSKGN